MKNQIEIKTARSMADAEAVAGLAKIIWTEHYTKIIGREQVEYMLNKFQSPDRIYRDISAGGYIYYMAYSDGELAGYAAFKAEEGQGGFLSKLYVEENFRGRGISKKIMNLIAAYCKSKNCGFVWLTVNKNNTNSIAAYKRMGFEIIDEIVADIGNGFVMDDYKMRFFVA